MDLKDVISISGLGGLFKLEAQRPNGVIVKALGEDQSRFVATRAHNFTPLENITIYDDGEGLPLIDVFIEMKKQEQTLPLPDTKADDQALTEYFGKVVPKYDREKVYMSDIRKLVKWYHTLDGFKLVDTEKPKEPEKKEEEKKELVEEKKSEASSRPEGAKKGQTHKKAAGAAKIRKKI